MKCPNENTELAPTKRNGVDLEVCSTCNGMWLTPQELNQLEDEVFDFGDSEKGTLVFDPEPAALKCPQCAKPMRKFQYRFYDLDMMFCDDGHGFWLEAGEDQRVLAFMKKEEEGLQRKVLAEDRWASHMNYIRSGTFLDRLRSLLR